MSIRNLDYLSTKEGANAFAVLLTAVYAATQVEATKPESEEDGAALMLKIVQDNASLYGNDDAKQRILLKAIEEFYYAYAISSMVTQTYLNVGGDLEVNQAYKLVAGAMFSAANFNASNSRMNGASALNRRDFIRMATFMYEMVEIVYRNMSIVNKDIPSKFH